MNAPFPINTLLTKATSVLSAVTTAPTKGTPIVDLMSYQVIASQMFLNWQFQEAVLTAPGTFTAVASTNIFTLTSHGFITGLKVRVSNSGGALPAGLVAATDYYVNKIDANTFYLSSTLLGSYGPDAINITTNGTGTNTVTPQAVAGTEGSGIYLLEIPGSYEVESDAVNIGTDTHANIVGRCSVLDSNGTPVDLFGYVTAYDSTHLAMVVNKDFVSSTNLGINLTDKPVKYSLQASFPIKERNYLY